MRIIRHAKKHTYFCLKGLSAVVDLTETHQGAPRSHVYHEEPVLEAVHGTVRQELSCVSVSLAGAYSGVPKILWIHLMFLYHSKANILRCLIFPIAYGVFLGYSPRFFGKAPNVSV